MKARILFAGAIVLAPFSTLYAQSSTPNAWSAWYGCWHATDAPASERLCIRPDGDGVVMQTVVDGQAREETHIVADDHMRDVTQDDCRGTERARWSNDRRRVFLNSDMRCGDARRESSGIIAFTDPMHWVSVQSLTNAGETSTRRTLYEAVEVNGLSTDVRNYAASSASQADIREAQRYVDDAAVQEWLNASESDYAVSSSAMDMLNRHSSSRVVVERPIYYDRVHVVPAVRIYWNPWGYDYWRYRPYYYQPYYRPTTIVIHSNNDRDRYRDNDHRYENHRDDDHRYDNHRDDSHHDGSHATRDGYTRSATPSSSQPTHSSSQQRDAASSSSSSSRSSEGRTAHHRN